MIIRHLSCTKYISPERAQITYPIGMKVEMQESKEAAHQSLKRLLQSLPMVAAPISTEESERKGKLPHARGTDMKKLLS